MFINIWRLLKSSVDVLIGIKSFQLIDNTFSAN